MNRPFAFIGGKKEDIE